MKKTFLLIGILLSLITLDASAQINDGRWFGGAGVGFNMGFDGQKFIDRDYSHMGAGLAVDVYFGKFFSERLGFRAGYHGLNSSNHFTIFGHDKFHYAHADFLVALGEVFVPYVHAGAVFMDRVSPAGGLGFMLPIKLSSRVFFTPDFKATFLSANAFADGSKKLGTNLSATLGVTVLIGK